MGISAISASNSYSSISNIGSQSNAEQLKLEKQKLQRELQQLESSPSGKSNQTKEKTLEQEISKIEQEIQQAGTGSTASGNQAPIKDQGSSPSSEFNTLG